MAVNNPSLQKYLHAEANGAINAIVTSKRKDGESAESYLERVAHVQGGLGVLMNLLSIEPPAAVK